MSNAETSKLYETIIEDVINDSRQDFEDSGIDESTLQELRRIWCEKLSQSSVAKFSWDEDDEEVDNNNIVQAEQDISTGADSNINSTSDLVPQTTPGISDTVDTNGTGLELPEVQLSYNTTTSAAPAGSIGIELPVITKKENDNDTGLMLPNINQADGTFEFTMYTEGNNGRKFFDSLKNKTKKTIKQVDGAMGDDDDDDDDGDDGDMFNDSDDVNSDLDDDLESDRSDDEDGDQEGQIMLCLYDKVQRIKNKWKSNLKEGIANIDGKDYVFQKATGESEW
ncbi:TOA1 [[Candida] subhashii]|uniref:Transcription initiation factor IIA large subunit n=1 Tax=[Candida] subhashii TaxID=561895 RepID=A0A8J5QIN3_9ASCO|nr:TOA1 [[Candida] subhashii]KAG7662758.1 TOA1 [[Candida] subhashii]